MEYLDPKKHKAHLVRLAIGYVLIGIALLLTTVILLYRAYGFGLKNGEVIQNGLIFVSSRPNPADMYVNGKKHEQTTNARLLIEAGQYRFELRRDGYRPWNRAINVEGGVVVRFDYPVLFPAKLTTDTTKQYAMLPALASQSPDRRWLLVQGAARHNAFDIYDLDRNDNEITPQALTLPENLFTLSEGVHSWKEIEWSSDNRRVLLQHSTDLNGQKSSEYILVDREEPGESVNLTTALGVNPTQLVLRDKKFDQYYLHTPEDGRLMTATLNEPQPQLFLENVLAFKPHGDDVLLYATSKDAAEGKTNIVLREADREYAIRQVSAGSKYLLELARYDNAWYVVAGAQNEGRGYVYRNPARALRAEPDDPLVPVQVLKAANANHVSFSDNARFIMAQGGQQFAVYDAENDRGYAYTVDAPMDAPQEHARWMDGHRLMFVSKSKTLVFDFDDANQEVLSAADAAYTPYFSGNFRNLYTVSTQTVKNAEGQDVPQVILGRTSLLTPQDQ
jgi:PEGA domain-containing protein